MSSLTDSKDERPVRYEGDGCQLQYCGRGAKKDDRRDVGVGGLRPQDRARGGSMQPLARILDDQMAGSWRQQHLRRL